ncbi:MAG: aminodeoxychorismate/anthranilate synthase component II [Nitrospinae bacterium]|nr:aminodeoxychorismate/anthranilate synthase component II [Nitrospinota bacterium]
MAIIIDNYDSFTYNLYQYIMEMVSEVKVFRNDNITIRDIEDMEPKYIVISPGPKEPKDAGMSKKIIERFGEEVNILGVCLGHQCINEVFGGITVRDKKVFHGKVSVINNDQKHIYRGLPKRLSVARYHSLVADAARISKDIEITAWTDDGVVMGIRHKSRPIEGVQFHPESFMTEYGKEMLQNYFSMSCTVA